MTGGKGKFVSNKNVDSSSIPSANSAYLLWEMTNHQFENFKQYLVKGTTGAKVNWLRCMLFYNNLHRFTRLICAIGLFPKLDEEKASIYAPSLVVISKALNGSVKHMKQAKSSLSSMSNSVLQLQRKPAGVYIRKIHIQDFLQEKSLLLPLLVHSWVMFAQQIDGRDSVWPDGYVVTISTKRSSQPTRTRPCLKKNPHDVNEKLLAPAGYKSLCPGSLDNKTPSLMLEFLPYVVMKSEIKNLDPSDLVWAKVATFVKDNEKLNNEATPSPLVFSMSTYIPVPKTKKKTRKKGNDSPDATTSNAVENDSDGGVNTINTVGGVNDKKTLASYGHHAVALFKNLDKVTMLLPRDCVQPREAWKWPGAKNAPPKKIVEQLLFDMSNRRNYMALVKLKGVLFTSISGWITLDKTFFDSKYVFMIQNILATQFPPLQGTDEDIQKIFNRAVEDYMLGNFLSKQPDFQLPQWEYDTGPNPVTPNPKKKDRAGK